MRLLYFRLKGYAGIYNGMGLDQIEIPFNQFKSRIILIQGENGCGKSTILNALSLEIDSSDMYRCDITYDGSPENIIQIPHEAQKEIHLTDGTHIYKVLIISPVKGSKRGTTKAYISIDGQEMNPNGNISSYKEIRDSVFEMDSNYMSLSMISAENRGLVDLTPSERKRFMASIIDSLDFYNQTYKILSKKSIAYKQNINTVKTKIYNIGDPNELMSYLDSKTNRLNNLDNQRKEINKKIAECDATIKILDPDSKIQDLYQSIVDDLGVVNSEINKYQNQVEKIQAQISKGADFDVFEEKKNLESHIQKLEILLSTDREKLSSKLVLDSDLLLRMEKYKNEINRIQSTKIRDDIENIVEELKDKISLYDATLQGVNMQEGITKSELESAKRLTNSLMKLYQSIYDNDQDHIHAAVELVQRNQDVMSLMKQDQKSLEKLHHDIAEANEKYNELKSKLDTVQILDHRPKECNIPTCYFIERALNIDQEQLGMEYEQCISDIAIMQENEIALQEAIQSYQDIYPIYQNILEIIRLVDSNSPLINKMPKGLFDDTIDKDKILQSIQNHHLFNEFSEIDFYISISDIIADKDRISSQLIQYDADLKIYHNNQEMIKSFSDQLKESEDDYNKNSEEIQRLKSSIASQEEILNTQRSRLELINQLYEKQQELDAILEKKRELGDTYRKMKDDITKVKEKTDKRNAYQSSLVLLEDEYGPLKEDVDQKRLLLSKLKSYQVDLDTWMAQYDKIENLKRYSSPTSGIQHVYISMYMNNTIKISNDLLKYLFNGDLQLMLPIINPDEFRIPFISRIGGEVSDISKGSTSQRCMIGMIFSFALLSQGSEKYNIIRLDEIDGGLDTNNRLQFVRMVELLMDIMEMEQCVMCSHNIETETYNAGIIHVTHKGLTFTY